MTLREFMAALAAFFVLYVLFVFAVIAAPTWKTEVGIASWCHDLETIREIVSADAAGKPAVGDELAAGAFHAGRCIRIPLAMAAFRPSGIVAAFPSFRGRPVTVLRGNLVMRDESLGRQVSSSFLRKWWTRFVRRMMRTPANCVPSPRQGRTCDDEQADIA